MRTGRALNALEAHFYFIAYIKVSSQPPLRIGNVNGPRPVVSLGLDLNEDLLRALDQAKISKKQARRKLVSL